MLDPVMQLSLGDIVVSDPEARTVWICAFWDPVTVSVGDVFMVTAIDPADHQIVFALLR